MPTMRPGPPGEDQRGRATRSVPLTATEAVLGGGGVGCGSFYDTSVAQGHQALGRPVSRDPRCPGAESTTGGTAAVIFRAEDFASILPPSRKAQRLARRVNARLAPLVEALESLRAAGDVVCMVDESDEDAARRVVGAFMLAGRDVLTAYRELDSQPKEPRGKAKDQSTAKERPVDPCEKIGHRTGRWELLDPKQRCHRCLDCGRIVYVIDIFEPALTEGK